MAITRYAGDRFTTNTSDTKPTGVLDGAYLIDTGNLTQWVRRTVGGSSQWNQLAGGGGGGGTPGGANTQVQFNNAGAFGGNANLTFDGSKLAANDLALSGIIYDSNNSIGNNGMVLTNEGTTGVQWKNIESVLSGVGGSGVANYVARWSDEDTITTGVLVDNGTRVGINVLSPSYTLEIADSSSPTVRIEDTTNNSRLDLRAEDSAVLIRSTSNFPMRFDVNQTERMRIVTDGNVGIGTTDPGGKLESYITSGGEKGLRLNSNFAGGNTVDFIPAIVGVSNAGFSIDLAGTNRLVINSNGNVGIGTNSPAGKLHILSSDLNNNLILESSETGGSTAPDLVLYRSSTSAVDNDYIGVIRFRGKNDNGTPEDVEYGAITSQIKDSTDGSEDGELALWTMEGGTLTQQVTLNSVGNVGIGTATPAVPLHITKSAVGDNEIPEVIRLSTLNSASPNWSTTDGLCIGAEMKKANGTTITKQPIRFRYDGGNMATTFEAGNVGIGTDQPLNLLMINGSSPIIRFRDSNAAGTPLAYIDASDGALKLQADASDETASSFLTLEVDGSEHVRVNDNGNVGIGTTAPLGKLHVYGGQVRILDSDQSPSYGARLVVGRDTAQDIEFYVDDYNCKIVADQDADSDGNHNFILDRSFAGNGDNNFQIQKGGSSQFLINTDGNVGINNTSPEHRLHVAGDAIISGYLYDSTNSTGVDGYVLTSKEDGPQWKMIEDVLSGVGGNGTATYIPVWDDSDTIGDSALQDNGSNLLINSASPVDKGMVSNYFRNGNFTGDFLYPNDGNVTIDTNVTHNNFNTLKFDTGPVNANFWDVWDQTDFPHSDEDHWTLSFWAKANVSGSVGIGSVSFGTPGGGGGHEFQVPNNDTWTKFTVYDSTPNNPSSKIECRQDLTNVSGFVHFSEIMTFQGDATYLANENDYIASIYDNSLMDQIYRDVNGNIGIGATAPASKLEVLAADPVLTIRDTEATVASASATLRLAESSATNTLNGHFDLRFVGTASGGDLDISRYNNTSLVAQGVRIKHDGNLGVGEITNPSTKLHIRQIDLGDDSRNALLLLDGKFDAGSINSGDEIGIAFNVENSGGGSQQTTSITSSYQPSYNSLNLQPAGGKVGIGTNAPSAKLHVRESNPGSFTYDSTADTLIVEGNGNAGITIATAAANTSRIIFASPNDPTGAEIKYSDATDLMTIGTTTPNDHLALQAGNGVEAVRIISGGNVGIGTTSPSEKLHVDGAGYFEGGGTRDGGWHRGLEITTQNANFSSLYFGGQSTTKYSGIIWTSSTSGNTPVSRGGQIYAQPTSATNTDIRFDTNNAVGSSSPTLKMIVRGDGKVGIGTAGPEALLHVKASDSGQTPATVVGLFVENDGSSNNYYVLQTATSGGGKSFSVTNAGNIGIGTAAPGFTLDIRKPTNNNDDTIVNIQSSWANTTANKKIGSIQFSASDAQVNSGNDYVTARIRTEASNEWTSAANVNSHILFQTINAASLDERMRIAHDGNVGIGANNPESLLHVHSATNETAAIISSVVNSTSGSYLRLTEGGESFGTYGYLGGYIQYDGSNNLINIGRHNINGTSLSDDNPVITIERDTGDVGIGTTSPDRKLDVRGNALIKNTLADLMLEGNVTSDGPIGRVNFYNTAGSDVVATIAADRDGANDAGAITFDTQPTGGGNTERMRITSGGNVAIGVTSANAKLKVVTSNTDVAIFQSTHATTTNFYISNSNATASNTANLYFAPANKVAGALIQAIAIEDFSTSANRTADLAFQTRKDGTFAEHMRIDSSGNVGIGTNNPTGKFQIGANYTIPGTSYGGDDIYIANTGSHASYDPYVTNTDDFRALITISDATTEGPTKPGLILYNDSTTAGGFSPMLLFAKRETGASPYKAATAAIYARSPLGTGNSNSWIDGELIFATAGAATNGIRQRMVINKEGLVGIGTNAPVARLHVHETTAGRIQLTNDTSNATASDGLAIAAELSTRAYFWLYEDAYMQFATNNAERIRITADGSVGIGTTSPSVKLHVVGSGTDDGIKVHSGTNVYLELDSTDSSTTREVAAKYKNYSTGTNFWWTGLNQASRYDFAYGTTFINANIKVSILTDGNVGIGTITPNFAAAAGNTVKGLNIQNVGQDTQASLRLTGHNATGNPGVATYTELLHAGANLRFDINHNGTVRFSIGSGGAITFNSAYTFPTAIGSAGQVLKVPSSGTVLEWSTETGPVSGTGTTNTIPRWTGTASLGDSIITVPSNTSVQMAGPLTLNYTSPILNIGKLNTSTGNAKLQFNSKNGTAANAYIIEYVKSATEDRLDFLGGGGTAEFSFLNSGQVGIGTTNPSQKLHVHNGRIAVTDGYNIGDTDANTGMFVSNDYFYVQTAGTTRMTVADNGKVGIGTNSPDSKLHVLGDTLKLERTNNAPALKLYNNHASPADGAALGYLQFTGKDNDGTANMVYSEVRGGVQANANTAVSGYLAFLTTNNGTSVTEAMRIKADGSVGIATTNPAAKLDVSGNILRSGLYYSSWTSRSINTLTSGGSTINYILIAPKTTINVRLSGRFNCARGNGVSAVSIAHADIVFCTDNDANPQSGGIHSAASDIPSYGHANFEIVELEYSSTEYYALKISPSTSWVASFNHIEFEGISNNVTWTNIDSGNVSNIGAFGGSQAVFAYKHANVGIGTDSPSARLHITSDGSHDEGAEIVLRHANNNSTDVVSTLSFQNNAGQVAMIQAGTTSGNTNGYISLFTDNSGTSGEKMRITSGGNVGIGTNVPSAAYGPVLHVRGTNPVLRLDGTGANSWGWITMNTATASEGRAMGLGPDGSFRVTADPDSMDADIQLKITQAGAVQFGDYGSGSFTGTAAYQLSVDSSGNIIETTDGGGNVSGSGTGGKIAKWSGANGLTDSSFLSESGTTLTNTAITNNFTGANTQIRLPNYGRIGVGTNSATSPFLSYLADNSTFSGDNALIRAYNGGNRGAKGHSSGSNLLKLDFNDACAMIVNKDGSVGIGTTSPDAVFRVVNSAASGGTFKFTDGSSRTLMDLGGGVLSWNAASVFGAGSWAGTADHEFQTLTTTRDTVYIDGPTSGSNHALYVDGSKSYFGGSVGIGTATPGAKLHVHLTGSAGSFSNIGLFRAGPDSNDSGAEIFVGQQGNSRGLVIRGGRGTGDQALAHFYLNQSGGTIPSTTQDHVMTFLQGGYVGIGTTDPGTNKLYVNGNTMLDGTAYVDDALTVDGNINFESMGQYITFYGNNSTHHSISSRNSSGNAADDLRINTYGALFINLDSNNNNTSGADFSIGRHGQTGAISDWLLDLSGETGKLRLYKYGSGSFTTGTPAYRLLVDSSGNLMEGNLGAGVVDGSGTTNYIARWSDTDTIGNSNIFDNGTIGIGTAANLNGKVTIREAGNSGTPNHIFCMLSSAAVGHGAAIFLKTSTSNTNNRYGARIRAIRNDNNNAAADLAFSLENSGATGLAEMVRFTSDGNVGIGTTSPDVPLHVNSSSDQHIILSGSTNPYIRFQESSTSRAYIQWHASYDSLLFRNEQADNFDFLTHATTGALNIRLKGSDHDVWGSFYAEEGTSPAHAVGILDADQHWALKHINDTSWDFRINNSSKMFINGTGVGIGTVTPRTNLHVYGTGVDNGLAIIRIGGNTNNTAILELAETQSGAGAMTYGFSMRADGGSGGDSTNDFQIRYHNGNTSGVTGFQMERADGNIGIGTTSGGYKLNVQGNVYISGTLTEASSLAIKENVETFEPSLDIINKIRPVKYHKKTTGKKEIGLIAEELAELFPELVEKDKDGNLSGVNYSRAVTVLLGGFKELYKEVQELKKRI